MSLLSGNGVERGSMAGLDHNRRPFPRAVPKAFEASQHKRLCVALLSQGLTYWAQSL